mgnify:CR=1 FL=1
MEPLFCLLRILAQGIKKARHAIAARAVRLALIAGSNVAAADVAQFDDVALT